MNLSGTTHKAGIGNEKREMLLQLKQLNAVKGDMSLHQLRVFLFLRLGLMQRPTGCFGAMAKFGTGSQRMRILL